MPEGTASAFQPRMHPLLDLARRPVVGHRGNAAHAPENTLESFRQAVALGADALEMDVHATADGAVVVLHDPTLDRTTDRSGRVDQTTLAVVKQADAGARFTSDGNRFPWRGRGLTIPTLDEVLESFREMPLLIELKAGAAGAPTRDVIRRHRAQSRCIVASFDDAPMVPFRGGDIPLGATRADSIGLLLPALLHARVPRPRYDAMCLPRTYKGFPVPLRRFAATLAPVGVGVHVWTVDDPAQARDLWSSGIRGIISNDPGRILGERSATGDALPGR
ncbi:MAG TPA: glycerophosphodiester phosphodiesterase [Gemmatimonadaceae bacterium]|nr:glycerophosphodiester phosphodiesterase [Gemmatimonadaceae bacterium]